MKAVNDALHTGGKTALLRSLQSEEARFSNVNPQNLQWYYDILTKATKDKAETEVSPFHRLSWILYTHFCINRNVSSVS